MAKRRSKKRRPSGKRQRAAMPARSQRRGETRASSKKATCLALLERAQGATIAELQEATGWQAHSVRGFLAGTVKRELGLGVAATNEDRGRVYRISPKADSS